MVAILFDLYETLVTESGTAPMRASSLGALLGLEESAFRSEWRLRRPKVVLGQLSFRQALAEISTALTGGVDETAVRLAYEHRIDEKAALFARIDQDIAGMISELRSRGHRLAVVSNCFAEDVLAWPTWPLSGEFQCAVFSHEVGIAKPDPEIYLAAIRKLAVDPKAAVFVGDGGDDELSGAERAGLVSFRAGWFVENHPRLVGIPTDRELGRCADVLEALSAR